MRLAFFLLLAANVAMLIGHYVQSSQQERLQALNASPGGDGRIAGAPLLLVSELSEAQRKELSKPKAQQKPAVALPAPKPVVQAPAPEPEKPLASAKAAAPVANQCINLGPMASAAQAEQVSQRLLALRIVADIVDMDVPGNPEYWVILPPFSDDRQALQKLHELQGRAIPAQIIPKGEFTNAISFGLHGQQEDADQQAAQLNARGYKVQVKAVPVLHKEKWLTLSERQSPKLTDEVWRDIQKDFSTVGKQVRNCR